MIVKLENGFLELNEDIEVEKKVKLFEDVSTTEGDFSYSFSIPKTHHNQELIKIYNREDASKRWAYRIPADILNDSGITIHVGFLRVESGGERFYSASFFSGNSNWIDELNFNLLTINWEDIPVPGVVDSWVNDYGIVFPLTDRGSLMSRRAPALLSQDDFNGYIYVKDIVNRVLAVNGMKMEGDLLTLPEYDKLITTSGNQKYLQNEIDKRKVFIGKSSNQLIAGSSSAAPVYYQVLFTDTTSPYYNSENLNWSTPSSRYNFDINVKEVQVDIYLPLGTESNSGVGLRIYKNSTDIVYSSIISANSKSIRLSLDRVDLGYDSPSSGDYYSVFVAVVSDRSILVGATITVTPKAFFKSFATDTIPNVTAANLFSNIFRMFNILVSYNATNKTFYANNFDKILNSEPIDLSEYLTIYEDNYEEFVSDYARNNRLTWSPSSNDFIDDYNNNNPEEYSTGTLNIDNDFLEETGDLVEMDFRNSWQYLNNAVGIELPYTQLATASSTGTRDLTSVTDSGGEAVFNYSGDPFIGIIRISESTVPEYNGDYYQYSYVAPQFAGRVPFITNATGKVELLVTKNEESDPLFLINHPNQSLPDVSGVGYILYNTPFSDYSNVAVANFLDTENYIDSLGFDKLKIKYFTGTEKLLNSGLKCYAYGNIPESIYYGIDFRRTVKIDSSVFYINRISGYKGSKYQVTFELIKK